MKVASLFAGIGGFEKGLAKAGHVTTIASEISEAANAVLRHRFPEVDLVGDVRFLDALPDDIEIIAAGYPCQDLSQAGATAGFAGTRSVLVNEIFRLIERRRVPWIVLENVPFMLQLAGGAAMRHVVDALELLGYRWAWRIVDAYGFGVPQRRERVILVASNIGDPADVLFADDAPLLRPSVDIGAIAHGFYWTEGRGGLGWANDAVPTLKNGSSVGIPSPPAILLPGGQIVKPDLRDTERLQGFSSNWTLPAETVVSRRLRWSLVGNAVCVPVATWVGSRLAKPGLHDKARDRAMPDLGRLPRAARFDGSTRWSVDISSDPIGKRPPPLATFLRHPGEPLSRRATTGFLSRTKVAKLRFAPGFIDAVEAHLATT